MLVCACSDPTHSTGERSSRRRNRFAEIKGRAGGTMDLSQTNTGFYGLSRQRCETYPLSVAEVFYNRDSFKDPGPYWFV